MFFPEYKFIDITSSITDCDNIKNACEKNKLTLAVQPDLSNVGTLLGQCLVCDFSNSTGPINVDEFKDIVGGLLGALHDSIMRSIELSRLDVTPPQPPSRFLFKTRADSEGAQARTFDKAVLPVILELECTVIGTDNDRFGEGSDVDELLNSFKENRITSLINLDLRHVANGEEGILIVSPLKTTDAQPVPARTIIMQL